MSDALSDYLVGRVRSGAPCVLKYLPYGALAEVRVDFGKTCVVAQGVPGDAVHLASGNREQVFTWWRWGVARA